MKKIRIKVDAKDGIITVKRGLFGEGIQFGVGLRNEFSLSEIIREFESMERQGK